MLPLLLDKKAEGRKTIIYARSVRLTATFGHTERDCMAAPFLYCRRNYDRFFAEACRQVYRVFSAAGFSVVYRY